MNTKQMADTAAILAMKAELDEERAMLDWWIDNSDEHELCLMADGTWQMAKGPTAYWVTNRCATPRAAIKEAMEKAK